MPQRTKSQVITSVQRAITAASPQVRVDAAKGPFYYLLAQGIAQPLADASADVERVAQLSTLQFPSAATDAEALALARAFGETKGGGGFASGFAYAFVGRAPTGGEVFEVNEGDTFATSKSGGVMFAAVESRQMTAANAPAFYNPANRRYEVPVLVEALTAGESGNIPPRTITTITNGGSAFDGATNLVQFRGGSEAQDVRNLYERVQAKFAGLDTFSRGGLATRVVAADIDRISAVALTYSSEYPYLFHRLPDGAAVDVWLLNTVREVLTTESYIASGGQTVFPLVQKPALALSNVFVNGEPVAAELVLDDSLEVGRSTRENSYVSLTLPTGTGDIVDITYTYDAVLVDVQAAIDGSLNASAGALFATDVLVRKSRTLPVTVTVTGTVLGTFDPTTVEQEVADVVGTYLSNGATDAPLLGGVRLPGELRDAIRAQVAGVAKLAIPVFARKSIGSLVEAIDIPRNASVVLESSADVVVRFT